MDFGIKGKWALVGGASKGLGWGCARALALEGVNVVMVARGAEVLNQAVADLQKEAPSVKLLPVAAAASSCCLWLRTSPRKLADPLYFQCLEALGKTLTLWLPTRVARPLVISAVGTAKLGSKP